jgi:hypothetical protein
MTKSKLSFKSSVPSNPSSSERMILDNLVLYATMTPIKMISDTDLDAQPVPSKFSTIRRYQRTTSCMSDTP